MMKKKAPRVCILSTVHEVYDSRIFYKEAMSLQEYGFDISFIVPHHQAERIDGIEVIPLKTAKNRLSRMIGTVWEAYRKAISQKADVYHFHDPELLPIGLLLRAMGKKVIYDVHEDVPRQVLAKTWIPKRVRKCVAWAFERFENFAARRMSAVVVVTPLIRDRFLQERCHVQMVSNFPKLSEFTVHRNYDDSNAKSVCYVGGITRVRGIFEMVEAISKTDGKLLLAGTFSSPQLRQEVTEMDGWEKVVELGYLNREQVKETLCRSLAGVYAGHPIINYVHSLPIKMFEYMAAGIPVIVSDFPILREIIEKYKCGIPVNPLDPGALAKAIQWIIDHPEEAERMGENGRRAVEENFNWEKESKALILLYKQLLDSTEKKNTRVKVREGL